MLESIIDFMALEFHEYPPEGNEYIPSTQRRIKRGRLPFDS